MRFALVLAAVLALILAPAGQAVCTMSVASFLLEINRVRAAHDLSPLRLDDRLTRAAGAHTNEMIRTGKLSHGSFRERMREYRVQGRIVGENVGWGVGPWATPAALVSAWMGSRGHRANLLRPAFRRVGLSAVKTTFRGRAAATVVTADFAG